MLGSENAKRLSQERSARALSPQLEEEAEGGGRAAAFALVMLYLALLGLWSVQTHHEKLQLMDMQFTFKLHVGHAICIMAILRHALCNMDMQFDKKVPCGHAIFFRMHVGHAIMKHQISDMCFDIRTWRRGIMWTCIFISDMKW